MVDIRDVLDQEFKQNDLPVDSAKIRKILDELEGESKSYYKNGVLKSSKNYKNGKLDGLSTWYFESGTFDEFIYFKDGKRPERKIRSVPVPSSFP